jgi:acyl carrier protein
VSYEIVDRVRATVSKVIDADLDPATDTTPISTLHERYDSLAVLDCVGAVEAEFAVSVDLVTDDLRTTFASVEAIAGLVERKLADQALLGSF